jgi:hypothetical protein
MGLRNKSVRRTGFGQADLLSNLLALPAQSSWHARVRIPFSRNKRKNRRSGLFLLLAEREGLLEI